MLKFLCWLVVMHTVLCLGITVGYHRLLTHRSFQCSKPVEYFWATLAWLALMGPPISWVAVHRFHHAQSDKPLDPHSPVQGGWRWAQFGWILERFKERALLAKGQLPERDWEWPNSYTNDTPFVQKYAKDICNDRYYQSLNFTWSLVLLPVSIVICFYLGGWAVALARLVSALTTPWATWFVNSYAHTGTLGYRNFDTRDASRNVWWVALVTQGEGWHNNHHHRPLSARHGMRWWEFDLSWCCIWTMEKLGLADKVYAYTYKQVVDRREESKAA